MTLAKRVAGAVALAATLLIGLPTANADPTPGKACHASTRSGDKVSRGTYNDKNQCCGPKFSNGSQLCINCDNSNNFCADGNED